MKGFQLIKINQLKTTRNISDYFISIVKQRSVFLPISLLQNFL